MGNRKTYDRDDVDQESQYALPYHYIPSFEIGHFSQHLYWSWGYRYLGGIGLILDLLEEESFQSLLDIGCGDGRFLREVNARFPNKRLLGVDYSQQAVNLARALNPDLHYECQDICAENAEIGSFDVVTLVEVLEHIPVKSVDDFVPAFARCHKTGGRLLVTVPHRNKPVQYKHYQHFDGETLKKILKPHYEIKRLVFFDKLTPIFPHAINGLLRNRLFILNNPFLLDLLFNLYRRYFFFCEEKKCGRICLIGWKK